MCFVPIFANAILIHSYSLEKNRNCLHNGNCNEKLITSVNGP